MGCSSVGGWDSSKIVSDTITLLLLEDSSASYAAKFFIFPTAALMQCLALFLCHF